MEKKRILIIEDNFEIREGTAEILELGGYEALTAPDGRVGVEMAMKHLPNLILCDIMMPELDGYGVLYMLGKNEATLNIPFIFLTAKTERADVRKAMEMGADDYLTKPFDDIELLNAIESRFKKRDRLQPTNKGSNANTLDQSMQEMLLDQLVTDARVKRVRKKQAIYEAGDTPHFVYYVKNGKVRTFLSYIDGRELSTAIYVESQFFGYGSPLVNEQYSDSAVALEDSEIALIPKESFFELLVRRPAIAEKMIRMLSGDIRLKEVQMLGFAYDSVRKRVANALVHVAEKSDTKTNDCIIKISRDDLATIAGTANETISRMLADFKDEQLISKEGNAIRIHSISKLRSIKN